MRKFYQFGNFEQVLDYDGGKLTYNCTCKWQSVGRFQKGKDFPCVHIIVAINEWTGVILELRRNVKRKNPLERFKDELPKMATK